MSQFDLLPPLLCNFGTSSSSLRERKTTKLIHKQNLQQLLYIWIWLTSNELITQLWQQDIDANWCLKQIELK